MRLAALVLVVLAACGPAVSSTQVRGPDGVTNWLAIECHDPMRCFQRAGEACPTGYDVADQRGRVTPARDVYARELLVHCHGDVAATAVGYRDCVGSESCNSGDQCMFTKTGFGDLGRCVSARTR
jgi:hypothetical protein